MSPTRRPGRTAFHCPRCGARVALAHREALIVRRLTVDYQHAVAARQHGDEVHVQCRCGGVKVIPWRLFQV